MTKNATYVYCLVRARKFPSGKLPRGLAGAGKTRTLDAGSGSWLVVADAPLDRYGEEAIARGLKDLDWVGECALAHERVIEHFLDCADALVPMKLFTLFSDDARALAFVARDHKRLDQLFTRLGGRVELGVRFRLDERRAARAERRAPASGTAFLAQKLAEQKLRAAVRREAAAHASEAHAKLAKKAEAACERPLVEAPSPRPLLLDAVYLVRRAREEAFRANAEALAKTLAARGVDLALTGPWPPYNFV